MIVTKEDLELVKTQGIPVEDTVNIRTLDSEYIYQIPEATAVAVCSDMTYVFSEDNTCNIYPTRNLTRIGFKVKE